MGKKMMSVITGVMGGVIGASAMNYFDKKAGRKMEEKSVKMTEFYHILERWLYLKQEKRSLAEYFEKNNYGTVAIYGMQELGERLYDELKDTNIKVAYGIDKKAGQIVTDINLVTPSDTLEPVDVVVVTAVHYFNEIEQELSGLIDCPILSLEDVIYDIL